MSTNHRMTQQSRRRLESADAVRISYLPDSPGYTIRADEAIVCSSVGSKYYDTPELAVRAVRRIRPDLSAADIPITWESRSGLREEVLDADDPIVTLMHCHTLADALIDATSLDPDAESDAKLLRHYLRRLESQMLESS